MVRCIKNIRESNIIHKKTDRILLLINVVHSYPPRIMENMNLLSIKLTF